MRGGSGVTEIPVTAGDFGFAFDFDLDRLDDMMRNYQLDNEYRSVQRARSNVGNGSHSVSVTDCAVPIIVDQHRRRAARR